MKPRIYVAEDINRLPQVLRDKVCLELATGCWAWDASLDRQGYGQLNYAGRNRRAHRVIYELLHGLIPSGLVLDHLCRRRSCVNPGHLEPTTDRINILRGTSPTAKAARATACPQGHPYDAANTYVYPRDGTRRCSECNRRNVMRYYRANREAVRARQNAAAKVRRGSPA